MQNNIKARLTSKNVRVLYLAWHEAAAGMLLEMVRCLQKNSHFKPSVCFVSGEEGYYGSELRKLGVAVHTLSISSHDQVKNKYNLAQQFSAALKLKRLLRNGGYDVVHLQESVLPLIFLSVAASKKYFGRLVLHNRGEFMGPAISFVGWIRRKIKFFLYRQLAIPLSDVIVVNSQFTKDIWGTSKGHEDKFTIIPNMIDQSQIARIYQDKDKYKRWIREEFKLPDNAFIIGVAARLVPIKRIELFLDVVAKLRKLNTPVYGLILGEGPEKQPLQNHAVSLGISGYVQFLGWQPAAKEILCGVDFSILPTQHEAFGIAALEALSLGIPTAIFWDAGGMCELVEKSRQGFICGSVDDMVRLIHRYICENGQSFSSEGMEAELIQKVYSITNYMDALCGLYE